LPGKTRQRIRLTAGLAGAVATLAIAAPTAAAGGAHLTLADPLGPEHAPAAAGAPLPTVPAGQADEALAQAQAALAGQPTAGDASTALAALSAALPSLSAAERRRGEALLARPTDGANDPFDDGYTAPVRAAASEHFCVFWVESGADAVPLADGNGNGIPDYIDVVGAVSEEVWAAEHARLGWRAPPSDGTLGCSTPDGRPRVDVYTKNVGANGLYGYAGVDPGQQGTRVHSFLVIDNDQAEFIPQYGGALPPMQVTLAHEYNHVIQYGYDLLQDAWVFESTATWMEEQVYPAVNDYLQYLRPWVREVETPLTKFSNRSLKVYGSAVWDHFLSRRLGTRVIINAWEATPQTNPKHLGAQGFDRAIKGARGNRDFLSEFVRFAAATAEWRSTGVFPDSSLYPEVRRSGTIATSERFFDRFNMDHTTFRLANVPNPSGRAIRLELQGPRRIALGLALVGRIGNGAGARVITVVRDLPRGGNGAVTISRPGRFSRLTAVLVNGEIGVRGFSARAGDWLYRGDDSRIYGATYKIR
jgi:hypothetical protein